MVQLSVSPNPAQEGETVTITTTLPDATSTNVSIPITLTLGSADEDDYGSLSSISITSGVSSGTGTDDVDTDDETFTVALGSSLPSGILTGSPSSVEVTIQARLITVSLSAGPNPVQEGKTITITVALPEAMENDVTIPLNVTSGTAEPDDYDSTSLVNIDITSGETEAKRTLNTYEDNDIEDETFTVAIDAENLPPEIILESAVSAEVTITDPDVPKVSLSVEQTSVEGGEAVTVMVELSNALDSDVTIPLILTPESDDYDSTSPVNIDVTEGQTDTEYTIDTYEDNDTENETFTVAIDTENLPTQMVTGSVASVEITITDNDTPGILAPVFLDGNEGHSEAVQVSLVTEPSSNVNVTVTGHEDTDLSPDPQVLTFSQENYNTPQTVTFITTEDKDLLSDKVTLTLAGSWETITRYPTPCG